MIRDSKEVNEMGQTHSINTDRVGNKPRWQILAIGSLGFWISTSLLLDLLIMPTLWATGMMDSSGFAAAGYSIFWVFNRLELLCAAIVLTSIWAMGKIDANSVYAKMEMLAGAATLFAISSIYTFLLTPYMSSLGMNLDLFATSKYIPTEMGQMHAIYWVLEASKLGIAAMLLGMRE
jgi:hypothetical protein